MNLSVKPGTVRAKTRLDHLCDLHCNVLTIKTGNEQKGNLCRGFKRGPLHWCFWKRASEIAFICSCTRELEEICFRGRVWSSTLAENHPIATLLETTKFYPKSFFQVLVVTDVNLLRVLLKWGFCLICEWKLLTAFTNYPAASITLSLMLCPMTSFYIYKQATFH